MLATAICLFFLFAIIAHAMSLAEWKIREEADIQKIDPELAVRIARCESDLEQGIKNTSGSSASGVFQFLRSTWSNTLKRMGLPPNLDVFDGDMNIKLGVWLLKTDGISHWLESKSCWDSAPLARR